MAFVWFNVLLQPPGGVERVEVCVGNVTVRAARGDIHPSSRDFHRSPPKTVNYGEGEDRVKVAFEESPLRTSNFTQIGSPAIHQHSLSALFSVHRALCEVASVEATARLLH